MKNCCQYCAKRAPHCHSTCKDYQDFVKANAERKAAKAKLNDAIQGINENILRCADMGRRHRR